MNNFIESIYHDGSNNFVSNPTPSVGEKISISLQMLENKEVTSVFMSVKYNGVGCLKKMELSSTELGLQKYTIQVDVFEKTFAYLFYILTNDCVYYYNEIGVTTYIPDETYDFKILVGYQQPVWVKNAIFYQIFPERFCNGDKDNDVKDDEYFFDGYPCKHIENWNSIPENYDKAHCLDFFGGDLQGIIQKIPYLKKLGVTALYLNPIFFAATVHKYDCLDYFTVDPHFGGNKALEELSKELHKNNMKLILDVSINHTGIANKWFNKEGSFFDKTIGAFNNPESEEREYYFFGKNNSYKSWFDIPTLPTLNYTSTKLREKIYLNKDSLVKKWLMKPYCIDGWRFDVADTMARNNEIQLHHEVWPQIRKSIKEENNQAYILAEDWSDCSEFLKGDEWDSQMNYYGCARPVRQFFGQFDLLNLREAEFKKIHYRMTAKDIRNQISHFLCKLPFVLRQIQFNLLDSHDVPRFYNDKNITKDKLIGALLMLFTLPGTTSIYYGDEAEIDGDISTVEGCRYPMPWNTDFSKTFSYNLYSTLCKIKTSSSVFSDGGFKFLYDKDYILSYARFTKDELVIIICSQEEQEKQIELPLDIFGNKFLNKKISKTDMLGQEIDFRIENNYLIGNIPKQKSFIIMIK